jgi:hypothetical protein
MMPVMGEFRPMKAAGVDKSEWPHLLQAKLQPLTNP